MYKIFIESEKNPIHLNSAGIDTHNYYIFSVEEREMDRVQ